MVQDRITLMLWNRVGRITQTFLKTLTDNANEPRFFCRIHHPFTRKRFVLLYFGRDVRTRLGVAVSLVSGPSVFHRKAGRLVKCLAQGHNKRTCRLVLHNLRQMLSAKQGSCGYYFSNSFVMTRQGD